MQIDIAIIQKNENIDGMFNELLPKAANSGQSIPDPNHFLNIFNRENHSLKGELSNQLPAIKFITKEDEKNALITPLFVGKLDTEIVSQEQKLGPILFDQVDKDFLKNAPLPFIQDSGVLDAKDLSKDPVTSSIGKSDFKVQKDIVSMLNRQYFTQSQNSDENKNGSIESVDSVDKDKMDLEKMHYSNRSTWKDNLFMTEDSKQRDLNLPKSSESIAEGKMLEQGNNVENRNIMVQSESHLIQKLPTSNSEKLLIQHQLNKSEWKTDFSDKIMYLINKDVKIAEIKINPPQLGPIEISLQVKNDVASLLISTHHSSVKEAVESSLDKLKNLLDNSGLQLGDVEVSDKGSNKDRTHNWVEDINPPPESIELAHSDYHIVSVQTSNKIIDCYV